jgi:hypothetical protein
MICILQLEKVVGRGQGPKGVGFYISPLFFSRRDGYSWMHDHTYRLLFKYM